MWVGVARQGGGRETAARARASRSRTNTIVCRSSATLVAALLLFPRRPPPSSYFLTGRCPLVVATPAAALFVFPRRPAPSRCFLAGCRAARWPRAHSRNAHLHGRGAEEREHRDRKASEVPRVVFTELVDARDAVQVEDEEEQQQDVPRDGSAVCRVSRQDLWSPRGTTTESNGRGWWCAARGGRRDGCMMDGGCTRSTGCRPRAPSRSPAAAGSAGKAAAAIIDKK